MAKKPRVKLANVSKKRQDRLYREQRQTRMITIGAITVLLVVILTVAYGLLEERYFRWQRAVAVVNKEEISAQDFRDFTKYYRNNLIQNAQNIYQIASMFESDPNTLQSFGQQLVSIGNELETYRAGGQAMDQLVDDRLIRQEARRLGITVSKEEVEIAMQEALSYYPGGTPTPTSTMEILPTSTLSPAQMTLLPPEATATPTMEVTETESVTATNTATVPPSETPTPDATLTPTPIITATATPRPTETPFTFEAYQHAYATIIAGMGSIEIPEKTIRYVIEASLYRQKLMDAVIGKIACVQEQVWAQHILVADESAAKDILQRLEAGEDWAKLAAEYSTDTSNKDKSGDLGWFGRGKMVKEFEDAAFALTEIGQISAPVQSQFGWHIIRLLGHEDHPLSPSECSQLPLQKFEEWMKSLRENSVIDIKDRWQEIVPLQPTLPADIQQVIQKLGGSSVPVEFSTPAP